MVRSCTLSLAMVLATGLTAQHAETLTIHFPLASAELSLADSEALRALCDRPDIGRVDHIALMGHTDMRGSAAYNRALSERRAKAVSDYLSHTCLSDVPFEVVWAGEADPLASGSSETALASNRRVEVGLQFNDAITTCPPIAYSGSAALLPAIDKPTEQHAVDASKPIDVTMSDGVRVRIAAGSLVDANGIPVQGQVQLNYRSFSEPYEIIASGIPMHVNTPDGVQYMETAGMYDLTASVNGQPVQLATGSSITLDPTNTPAPDDGYITWALDETNGQWNPAGTLMIAAPTIDPVPSNTTAATNAYWQAIFSLENEAAPDSTHFADRRRSGSYCHLTACDTNAAGNTWIKSRNRFRDEGHVPEISVVAYKGIYDPEHVVFGIKMPSYSLRQFPEWRRVPHNALFEYTGSEPRAAFKRLYGRRHFFQDIALDIAAGSTDGSLWLKENGEWIELPVSVSYDQQQPLRAARWNKAMMLYTKALARRTTSFDREVNKRVARYDREHANMPLAAWKQVRDDMSTDEKQMDLQAWLPYAQERPYVPPVNYGESPWAMFAKQRTSISIYGFGKVNVDRYLVMPDQVNVIASTTDNEGNAFPWVRAYAVPKGRNAVITYQGRGEGRLDALLVAPGYMQSLVLVDAEGRVMSADVRPLNAGQAKAMLHVQPVENLKSIEEFRALAMR